MAAAKSTRNFRFVRSARQTRGRLCATHVTLRYKKSQIQTAGMEQVVNREGETLTMIGFLRTVLVVLLVEEEEGGEEEEERK